jgi:hypothetical protein
VSSATRPPREGVTDWLRPVARAVSALWAAWWTFFAWASVLTEGATTAGLFAALLLTTLFFASAAIAWRWERWGGLLLTVEGLLVLLSYPQAAGGLDPSTITFVLLTLALPPLVAGTLFLACRKR